MNKYSYEEIKKLMLKCINEYNVEAELRLKFEDKINDYMIIIYKDHCSFQRCGTDEEQSGEYNYNNLDELYNAQLIDDIILKRDWNKIKEFDSYELYMGDSAYE